MDFDTAVVLCAAALGWTIGSFTMWFHFARSGLIRSRSEYYRERARNGRTIPVDWNRYDNHSEPVVCPNCKGKGGCIVTEHYPVTKPLLGLTVNAAGHWQCCACGDAGYI